MKKLFKILLLLCLTTLSLSAYTVDDIPNGYFSSHGYMCDTCTNNRKDIRYLQVLLNTDDRLSVSLTEDGYWGNNTKNGVEDFQSEYGLSVDGHVGNGTKSKLDVVLKRLKNVDNSVPSKPAHVIASNDGYIGKIRIYSYSTSGATSYEIYRGVSISANGMSRIKITTNTSYYDSSNLEEGRKYYYRVKACNSNGCSDLSDEYDWGRVKTQSIDIPPKPTLISPGVVSSTGSEITDKTPTLRWNATSDATYYRVAARDINTNNLVLNTTNITGTSYTLPTLTAGHKYYWDITACNSAGCGIWSDSLYFKIANNQKCQPELQFVRDKVKIRSKSGTDSVINSGELFDIEAQVYNDSFECSAKNFQVIYKYGGRTSSVNDVPFNDSFKMFDNKTYGSISPRKFSTKIDSKDQATLNLSGVHWVEACVSTANNLHGEDCIIKPFEVAAGDGQTNSPQPYIHNVDAIDFNPIHEGDKATISIFVTNKGGSSNDGGITVSFPTLTSPSDKSRVPSSSKYITRGKGDTIYNKYGKAISADYLMIEFSDNDWKHNEKHELNFQIRLDKGGQIPILIRSAMKDKEMNKYINTPADSIRKDQQGWSVINKFIEVLDVDRSDSYREFSVPEITNFNNNQMYKLTVYNKIFEMSLYQMEYYRIHSDILLKQYKEVEYYRKQYDESINNIVNIHDGIKLSKEPKLDFDTKKYIIDNIVDIVGDMSNKYYPGSKFEEIYNTGIKEGYGVASNLYDCVKFEINGCINTYFNIVVASARVSKTYKIIDDNKAINAHTIALASIRNSIRKGITYISDSNIDNEIRKIVNQIDTISTSTIFTPYDTVYDSAYTKALIKRYHYILANINYGKLIKLNDDIDNANMDNGNNLPSTPTVLSPSNYAVNVDITPNVSFSSFNGDTHLNTWFDIRKVSDNKYLYDSGWLNGVTTSSVPSGYLSYNTRYKIRVVYRDGRGKLSKTGYSYFTTRQIPAPTIKINNATNVTQNEATIWSNYNTYGVSGTQTNISWGKTSSLGNNTHSHTIGINKSGIDHRFTGLECGTTYYYRANISNDRGSNHSDMKNFTTLPCGAKVTMSSSEGLSSTEEYDDVPIGTCVTRSIHITKQNDLGSATGTVGFIYNNDGAYSLKGGTLFTLSNKKDSKEFKVEFCPTQNKAYAGVLKATSNGTSFTSNRDKILLAGKGVSANALSGNNDFYLSNATVDKTTVKAGESLRVSVTQNYSGDNTKDLKVYAGYYLSKDNIWDANDKRLNSDTSYLSSTHRAEDEEDSLTIPEDTQTGDYYILYVADYKKQYAETNEDNNVKYVPITVKKDSINTDDFYITDYSLSGTNFIAGDNTVYVNSNLCFSGSNPNDARTNVGYYLSNDNTLDSNDRLIDQDSLGYWDNDRLCRYDRHRLHLNGIEKGNYYIITALDINNTTIEQNEYNNIASEKITVKPQDDFYITNLTLSKEVMNPNDIFDINLGIAYSGSSTSALNPKVKIYLSHDSNIDSSDKVLFTVSSSISLSSSNREYIYTDKLRIPISTDSGNYYLLMDVDYDDTYDEINEDNNIAYKQLVVDNQNVDADDDGDGHANSQDAFPNDPAEWLDTDGDGTGDNADLDDDNDGISDADEIKWGLDPLNPSDGGDDDADGDGVSNADEITAGSDPLDPDDTKKPKRFVPIIMDDIVIMVPYRD